MDTDTRPHQLPTPPRAGQTPPAPVSGQGAGPEGAPPDPAPTAVDGALATCDPDGNLQHCDQDLRNLLALRGGSLLEVVTHPDDVDEVAGALADACAQPGTSVRRLIRIPAHRGWRTLRITALAAAASAEVVVAFQEITELLAAQHELDLADRAPAPGAAIVVDEGGHITFASRALLSVGIRPSDVLGLHVAEILGAEQRDPLIAAFAAVTTSGAPTTARWEMVLPDGHPVLLETTVVDLRADPVVQGFLTTTRDVTEQEAARRAGERRFQALIEHATDLTVLTDGSGRLVDLTPAALEFAGRTVDEMRGSHVLDPCHYEDRPEVQRALETVLADPEKVADVTARLADRDGRWHWVQGKVHNLLDLDSVGAVVWNMQDVTDRQEAIDQLGSSERRFRKLVQNGSDIIMVCDRDAMIRWVSPAVTRVLGHDPDEVVGTDAANFLHPDDFHTALDGVTRMLVGETTALSVKVRVRHANGTWRWVGVLATDLTADPDVGGLLLNIRDITARVSIQVRSEHLSSIVESTTDLVGIVDSVDQGLYLNAAARRFFGSGTEGLKIDVLTAKLTESTIIRWRDEVLPGLERDGQWSGELLAYDALGDLVPLGCAITANGPDERPTDVVSFIARDVRDQKELERRLAHDATHDPLTGLPNRTLLLDRLGVALARAHRNGTHVAVLFLDLDHFKVVNDSLGHNAGDRLLVLLADRLVATLRPGDTVARFGGDEFVIVCEEVSGEAEARRVADRVADAVCRPLNLDGNDVVVRSSVGIALASPHHTTTISADDLLRDADAAMYEAKARGRARTEVFDSAMRTRVVDRLELESALRRAVDRHELRVWYQPIVNVVDGTTEGFEALLRWEHPTRGLLAPGDFLAIAEESRLIVPIGAWVLRQACRVIARLRATLPGAEHLTVSVNLSARQLMHPTMAEELEDVLRETALPPEALLVEITESVLMEDLEAGRAALQRLKDLGLQVAVDDFGTGYSSLAWLRSFPVDVLKVDRSFVSGLDRDQSDAAIVSSVIHLAHSLGMRATAEGVEEPSHLDALRGLGCDLAQGYLLSRPVPDTELRNLLARPLVGAAPRPTR